VNDDYVKGVELLESLLQRSADAEETLNGLDEKLAGLRDGLEHVEQVVTVAEIEEIIKQLKDMEDGLSQLEGELGELEGLVDDEMLANISDLASGFKAEQIMKQMKALK